MTMPTNILAFDIETVPDTQGGRSLYDLPDSLSDADVCNIMFNKRRDKVGHEFLAHHQQQVVAISAVYRNTRNNTIKVWSLGDENSDEKELIQRFFDGVDKFTPTLVTWNGAGFDLPVLQQRGLITGVQAARYWDTGEDDPQFKWNNYINRYQYRHTDLMDVLASFSGRANAPLDEIAVLLGFPGKMGMDGSQVSDAYLKGEIKAIRDYCETDALNTYLVYLRWLFMRGSLDIASLEEEIKLVKKTLKGGEPHFERFLDIWGDF